jgi:hypothetical protein
MVHARTSIRQTLAVALGIWKRISAGRWLVVLLATVAFPSSPAIADAGPTGKIQICRAAHTQTVLDQATVIIPKGATFIQGSGEHQAAAGHTRIEIATQEDAKLAPGPTCATVSATVLSGQAPVSKGIAFDANDRAHTLIVIDGPTTAAPSGRPPLASQPNYSLSPVTSPNPYSPRLLQPVPKPSKWTIDNLALVTTAVSDFH